MFDLRIIDAHTAVAWLEDDFHHFGVTVQHDGALITGVRMAAPRTPWSTCPGAVAPLQKLVGKRIVSRASEIGSLIDMRLQCTHVFDLTGLLLAHVSHAAERGKRRRYHTVIPDRARHSDEHVIDSFGPGTAKLYCDDKLVMSWEIDGEKITGPAPYDGHSQNVGFRAWTESMPEEEAEYANILRRAILVAGGRTIRVDDYPTAASMGMPPVCHSYQPEQRNRAKRCPGTTLDYTNNPNDMLINVAEVP